MSQTGPPPSQSGTIYDRLLRGEATSAEYVAALRAEASERMRDSLRLERDGLEFTRRKDNEYLLGKIDELKACLRDLMDAADRDRQGVPLPYEEWRIRYDEARRLVGEREPESSR